MRLPSLSFVCSTTLLLLGSIQVLTTARAKAQSGTPQKAPTAPAPIQAKPSIAVAPPQHSCTMTLSGALTATATCTVQLMNASASGQVSFALAANAPSNIANITGAAQWSGTAVPGTFSTHNLKMYGFVVVGASSSHPTWAWATTPQPMGSGSITITSTGVAVESSTGSIYTTPQGSVSVTLAPMAQTGASGNLIMTVKFQ